MLLLNLVNWQLTRYKHCTGILEVCVILLLVCLFVVVLSVLIKKAHTHGLSIGIQSGSQSLGSMPTGDNSYNRYFLAGPQLPSQTWGIAALRPLPDLYWQRHIAVNSLPKVIAQ